MANAKELAAQAEELRKQAQAGEEVDDVVIEEEEGADGDDDVAADKSPPGFLSYEDYIKAGKDPKKYKGEDAYNETYAHIHEIKGLKKELKTVSQSVQATMDEWRATEREKVKAELQADLKRQKDEGDIEGVLETKEKLDSIRHEEKTGAAPKLLPVIEDYIQDNPILDAKSDDFDQDTFEDFRSLYDAEINKMTAGTGMGLSERQIQRALGRALNQAQDLNKPAQAPTRSPRNDRAGPGRQATRGGEAKQSIEVRLKNMKFQDNRNPDGNPNPAYAAYLKIKATAGPKAAERFAKAQLGE